MSYRQCANIYFFSKIKFVNVCVYRMVYIECSPTVCPCGVKCSNQRIQRHDSAVKFEKFLTQNCGYGVKTVNAIASGMLAS